MKRLLKYITIFFLTISISNFNLCIANAYTTEEESIKLSITNFFDRYFNAFEKLDNSSAVNMARNNDNLYIFQRAHDIEIKYLKEFDLGYKYIKFDVEYIDINVNKFQASVETLVDMRFRYNNLEKVDSGIYNVDYKFKLIKDSGIWRISNVESDYEKYRLFMEDVNRTQLKGYQRGHRSGLSKRQAADNVFNEHLDIIYKNKVEKSSKIKGAYSNKSEMKEIGLNNKNYLESGSYYVSNGVEYALKFAEAPLSERFFYTAKSDCTNFVSQCIWSAYGGYVKNNILQIEKNIKSKFKMTAQWFGNSGGGTPPWESVDRFYQYMKNSKAKVYNDNSLAIEVDPDSIKVGDVLQFRRRAEGRYTHSVYVTENLGIGEFNGIFVCQHSTDWKNRNLEDLILSPGWGGYDNCYMRHLSFNGGSSGGVKDNKSQTSLSAEYTIDISEEDIDEGKRIISKYYDAINNRDYNSYLVTLGSYRKMRNGDDFGEFIESKKQFKVKEIGFPGRYHDIEEYPHSYEKAFYKKPYRWMYMYVLVEEVGLGRNEEMDFILIQEDEGRPWQIHDVGV